MGRCKDRPGDRRCLSAALGALIEIAGRHHAVLPATAYRTLKAMRPAVCNDDCPALLLGAVLPFERRFAETFLELHDITSHCHNLMKQHRIPGLLPSASWLRQVRNQERLCRRRAFADSEHQCTYIV